MVKLQNQTPDILSQKKKRKKSLWVKEVLRAKKKNKISFKDALLLSSSVRKQKITN